MHISSKQRCLFYLTYAISPEHDMVAFKSRIDQTEAFISILNVD